MRGVPMITSRQASKCLMRGCRRPLLIGELCESHHDQLCRLGACGVVECGRPVKNDPPRMVSSGLCVGHYERLRKHGDVLVDLPLGSPRLLACMDCQRPFPTKRNNPATRCPECSADHIAAWNRGYRASWTEARWRARNKKIKRYEASHGGDKTGRFAPGEDALVQSDRTITQIACMLGRTYTSVRDRRYWLRSQQSLSEQVGEFVQKCCIRGGGQDVLISDLYSAWTEWCGKKHITASDTPHFATALHAVVPEVKIFRRTVNSKRVRAYSQLGLR